MNIKEIIEGWRNDLIPPKTLKEVINTVSEERLAICAKCPFNSKDAENYKTLRIDYHCVKCGCPLKKKTKSLSSECPIENWGAYLTNDEKLKLDEALKNENKLNNNETT